MAGRTGAGIVPGVPAADITGNYWQWWPACESFRAWLLGLVVFQIINRGGGVLDPWQRSPGGVPGLAAWPAGEPGK